MKEKVRIITNLFKQEIKQKYDLIEMRLFGSSARGDSSDESDIDILVRLPEVNRKIEEELFDLAYNLELEYDCLIDVIVLPLKLEKPIPLYDNIDKESILI